MELLQTNTPSSSSLIFFSPIGIYQGFSSKEDPDCTIRQKQQKKKS